MNDTLLVGVAVGVAVAVACVFHLSTIPLALVGLGVLIFAK